MVVKDYGSLHKTVSPSTTAKGSASCATRDWMMLNRPLIDSICPVEYSG